MNSARNLALHGKRLVEQNKALRQVLLDIGIKSEFESQMILRVCSTQCWHKAYNLAGNMDLVQCAHSPNTKADCVTELLCTLPFRRYNSSLQKYFETIILKKTIQTSGTNGSAKNHVILNCLIFSLFRNKITGKNFRKNFVKHLEILGPRWSSFFIHQNESA